MAMVTVYSDRAMAYAVEEDAQGGLWLAIDCPGVGSGELHRRLAPGEERDFRSDERALEARVRAIRFRPESHFRREEEIEYRKVRGG